MNKLYDSDLLTKIVNKTATPRLCDLTFNPLMLGAYFYIGGEISIYNHDFVNDYCMKHYGKSYDVLSVEDSEYYYYSENEDSEQFFEEIKEQGYYYNSSGQIVEYGLNDIENLERLSLLHLLQNNDRNGVFLDSDCIREFGSITTLAHAKELYNDYF